MKKDYINTRSEYVEKIKKELLGPGSEISIPDSEHELISSPPNVRYSIGILFPQKQRIEKDNDDSVDEETVTDPDELHSDSDEPNNVLFGHYNSNEESEEECEEESLDEQIGLAMQNLPSSMGYTFLAKGNCDRMYFSISFGTYRKSKIEDCMFPVPEDLPDNYILPAEIDRYLKFDNSIRCLRLKSNIRKSDIKEIYERDSLPENEVDWLINSMYRLYDQLNSGYVRCPHYQKIDLNFAGRNYCDKDIIIDDISLKLTALKRKIDNDVYSVTVMIVNPKISTTNIIISTDCVYQIKLCIDSSDNDFVFENITDYNKYESEDEEELSNRLLYRNKKVYGSGLGTSVVWNIDDFGKGTLKNDFFPETEVPSMDFGLQKNSITPNYILSMKQLSDLGEIEKNEIISGLKIFVSEYNNWINSLETQTISDKLLQTVADVHIKKCRVSYERMVYGISILENNESAWNAFRLANRAMYMQRLHLLLQTCLSGQDRFDGDRELASILNNLNYYHAEDLMRSLDPGFKDPSWRPFQLAFLLMNIKSMTLDKSDDDNNDRNIVDLIWFPTGGGKTEAYLGLTAFTIFHRRLEHRESSDGTAVIMRYTLRLLAAQQFTRASTLICACEYIRSDCRNGRNAYYPVYDLGDEKITIGLWIGGKHTPNKNTSGQYDRPGARECLIKLIDSGINNIRVNKEKYNKFQVLKCPWCGTKMTKEILNGRIMGAWGYQMDARGHFYLKCTNQDCFFCDSKLPIQIIDEELYDNPPTLLFGTVDKFAMLAWKKEVGAFFAAYSDNRAPELIIQDELHLISGPLGTMVAMFETAMDYLCKNKGIRPKIIASTATIKRAKEQCAALYDRDVAQFPSPGLDAGDSYFAKEKEIDYEKGNFGRLYVGLMSSGKTKAMMEVRSISSLMQSIHVMELTDEIKDKYWTLTVYFGSLKDLGKCHTLAADDIKDAIKRQAQRLGRQQSRRKYYSPDELTSRISTTELNETLDKLEKTTYSNDNYDKVSHLLLASNMISVGIDVARLNVMLLVGQPKLTSEYIQASSRVGRSYPGVVFTMYDASKSRDRSHFEQFKQYHESFYRYVEPTGATPFSKPSRDRSLKALLVAMIRNTEETLSEEDNAREFNVQRYQTTLDRIESFVVSRSQSILRRINPSMTSDSSEISREIKKFFTDWENMVNDFGTEFSYGEKYMIRNPDKQQGRLLKSYGSESKKGFDAMTSMRNVDTTVSGNIILWED